MLSSELSTTLTWPVTINKTVFILPTCPLSFVTNIIRNKSVYPDIELLYRLTATSRSSWGTNRGFFSHIYATSYSMVPSVLSDFEDKTEGPKTYNCPTCQRVKMTSSSSICSVQTTTRAPQLQLQFHINNPTVVCVPAEIRNLTHIFRDKQSLSA